MRQTWPVLLVLLIGCGGPPAEPPAQPGTVAEAKATEGKATDPVDSDKVLTLRIVAIEVLGKQAAIIVSVKNNSPTKLVRFIETGEVHQIAARQQANWPVSVKDEHGNEYAPPLNLHPFFHGMSSKYMRGGTHYELRPGDELHFDQSISLPVAAAKTLTLKFPPLSVDKAEGDHVFKVPLQERDFTRVDIYASQFDEISGVLGKTATATPDATKPAPQRTVRAIYVNTDAAGWFLLNRTKKR